MSERQREEPPRRDRSLGSLIWYRFVQYICAALALLLMRWRAKGQGHIPAAGGVLLVCNHVSFLDVFFVGIPLRRPLNYVARSTLFVPVLGMFIRSVGGFPIQREGIGASGMKETLKRLKAGGIVDAVSGGDAQPRRRARAAQAGDRGTGGAGGSSGGSGRGLPDCTRAGRGRGLVPVPHPVRIHYGPPILPSELAGLDSEAVTELIRRRMQAIHEEARRALRNDMEYL